MAPRALRCSSRMRQDALSTDAETTATICDSANAGPLCGKTSKGKMRKRGSRSEYAKDFCTDCRRGGERGDAACGNRVLGVSMMCADRRIAISTMISPSQMCTNQVVLCKTDNAHPVFIALGYNRVVRIAVLDLQQTGCLNVIIVNCTSNSINLKSEAKRMWDVYMESADIPPGESDLMIIERNECHDEILESAESPDVEIFDLSGNNLCTLYIQHQHIPHNGDCKE